MSKPDSEKKKMATIREVYNRIVWDARLDRNAFAIAYIDRTRLNSIREKPLSQWVADGDIPWHRVRYIRCGETIVWDRDRHLDLISTGQLPAAAWATSSQKEAPVVAIKPPVSDKNIISSFEARSLYQYNLQEWQAKNPPLASVQLSELTIASFNVLSDMHEAESIQTHQRIPAILESLRNCNADIIALQEVTRSHLEALLKQDWMRDYFISESPEGSTIEPYGIVLLSRLPFNLVERQYSAHKRVLVGTWQLNGQFLHLAAVHLPSNRAQNAVEVRSHQLYSLLNYLQTLSGDCLIVGDFNSNTKELQPFLTESNFVDIWQELHDFEAGYTFDPLRNPLAALMSHTGEPGRLDRILLRTKNRGIVARLLELFACEPIPDTEGTLYASDHFGLRAVLELPVPINPVLQTANPTYRSAIVIIPPAEVWPPIQALRRQYDRQINRWMPHFTLIYGFLAEEYFEEAALIIARSLLNIKPFQVTLTNLETFEHRASCTAWLQPVTEPPEAINQLQAVLQQLFPQCNEQSNKSSAGFTPHLSVGQFKSAEEARSHLPIWHPISFSVESIALISRRADEPFEVRYQVTLGSDLGLKKIPNTQSPIPNPELIQLINHLEPELSLIEKEHRQTILAIIAQACGECLGFEASLQLLGSARLGVESPQSDLDVICLIPTQVSGKQFLENVRQKLEGLCDRARLVEDARVPVLRMQIEEVSVDLLYANIPGEIKAIALPPKEARNQFDAISWKALVGCLESDAIADIVQTHVSIEAFRMLLRAVRSWAKIRQIHGNAWGFLGSFSWALLATACCANYPKNEADKGIESFLAHFFKTYAEWDWSQPVALTEAATKYRVRTPMDWLPIVTSIEPCQNSARNVTRSTAQLLQQEFARSAEIIEEIQAGKFAWEALFEPADLLAQSPLFVVLTGANSASDWLKGRAIGLVIELEKQLNARVRPWPSIKKQGDIISFVLGIELVKEGDSLRDSSASRTSLEQIARDFVLQFNTDGSTLDWVLCDRPDIGNLSFFA